MTSKKSFLYVLLFVMYLPQLTHGGSVVVPREQYRSPYSVKYSYSHKDLVGDIVNTQRGSVNNQASIPYHEWYSPKTLRRYGSWGPRPRHYKKPDRMDSWSVQRCRERVIAVGLLFKGYMYQHHHIPDWNPPGSWPWKSVDSGIRGKGVDCSNFTSFVFALGFGLKIPSGCIKQNAITYAEGPGPGNKKWKVKRIDLPESYEDQVKVLQTGDLVYIKKKHSSRIGHVLLWVGQIGRSPDNTPLYLDSSGGRTPDCSKIRIPDGIYLRPYRKKYWPYKYASHAIRFFY